MTCGSIVAADQYNVASHGDGLASFGNEIRTLKLSPTDPQAIVNKLLKHFDVGTLQREEIKHRRGFPQGAFGYNEIPTSSCQTFCWKARQGFDVPFFCSNTGHRPIRSLRD